jgi:hypothetical protein
MDQFQFRPCQPDPETGETVIMSDLTYETLRKRVSDELNAGIKEFGKTVEEVDRHFRYLGFAKAVWMPDKIHVADIGGLDAESYVGYARVEGKWGLSIRTVERDCETRAFVSQRVYSIGSSGNMELVANAMKKVPDLLRSIDKAVTLQIKTLAETGTEYDGLRDPDFKF